MTLTDEQLAELRKAMIEAIALLDVAIAGTVFTKPQAGRVIVNVERAQKVLDGLRGTFHLIAELSQLRAQAAWRPMESAPRDGTSVLLFGNHKGDEYLTPGCIVGAWSVMTKDGGWRAYGDFSPRAWMPLPAPPSQDSSGTINPPVAQAAWRPDRALHVVFDGPPGPEAGRFVECETPDGHSICAGTWHERPDGFWELRIAAWRPDREEIARIIDPDAFRSAKEWADHFVSTGERDVTFARLSGSTTVERLEKNRHTALAKTDRILSLPLPPQNPRKDGEATDDSPV